MTRTVEEQGKAFSWEVDPLYFIFNQEIPGKSTKDTVFVTNADDSTALAKQELLEKVISYLPKRFPDKFEKTDQGIYNKILEESISADPDNPIDPLIRLGKLTQEDWTILEWDEEASSYKLTAGIVYFPMRWSLLDKWNKSMPGIHAPVKGFMKHLVKNVQSLFKAMTPSAPFWRANWAVFNDLSGPLDLYTPTDHTNRNEANQKSEYEGEVTGKKLMFRAEYQTFTKLPKSEAIVFSIRTYQRYLADFKNHPISDTKGLIKAIDTLDKDFFVYKGAEFWKDAALKYLRQSIKDRSSTIMSNRSLYILIGTVVALGFAYCFARYME
eukprot:gene5828-6525_t